MVLCLLLFFGGQFRLVNYFDSEIVRSLSAYFGKTRSEIGYSMSQSKIRKKRIRYLPGIEPGTPTTLRGRMRLTGALRVVIYSSLEKRFRLLTGFARPDLAGSRTRNSPKKVNIVNKLLRF